MRRFSPRAITLVELLVVIGIISMLIALLLPAVLSGRAQAEQARCQKQMKEWAAAALQHAMRKGRFPGYAETFNVSGGTETVGWVPTLFPYVNMQDRTRQLLEQQVVSGVKTWPAYIDVLVCPSDPPDLEAPFWSEADSPDGCGSAAPDPAPTIPFPTSYAVNAGRMDDPTATPPDEARYAVFHDRRNGVTKKVSVGLDDLSDGKRATMLITENVDLAGYGPYMSGATLNTSLTADPVRIETHNGVVYVDGSRLAAQASLNQGMLAISDCNQDGLADNLLHANARPSSFHQEGFNAAYADGSVEFFFVDPAINPNDVLAIYSAKMTPANED